MSNTTKSLGGYSLVSFKEAGGEETVRFEAYIALNGKKVMHVSNGGTGGCHRYGPVGPFKTDAAATKGYADFRQAEVALEAFAAEWNKGTEFAGSEDADQFVDHLVEVAVLNKMRKVLFLVDDQDYFATGVASSFGAGVTYHQTVAELSKPKYAASKPRVWNKEQSAFVAV